MTEEKSHSASGWEKIWEMSQNIAIVIGIILGLRGKPAEGSPEAGRIPGWILSSIPEQFTGEDEIWRNLIQSSTADPQAFVVEAEFRQRIESDGFDAGKYRVRLMDIRKEFLEQSRKGGQTAQPNERIAFETVHFREPLNDFFSQLIAESETGETPDEIYGRQKKIALARDLLEKTGGLKKTFLWSQKNKGKTLFLLFTIPFVVFTILVSILYAIFG